MAKQVFLDAYVAVNGTNLSDHFHTIAIEDSADEVELTGFSATYKEFGQGLKDGSITGEVYQDFAASSVDSVLYPLYASGGTFTVEVRPTSAAASSTNPKYTMVCRLYEWSPLNGSVGEANNTNVVFRNAGTGIVRGTS